MEKVLQRVKRLERSTKRKADKNLAHKLRQQAWQRGQIQQLIAASKSKRLRQDKINRKIDWMAGPLAPRRDVGEQAEKYGSIQSQLFYRPDRDPLDRPEHPHIRIGDRVVVVKGRDRGAIAKVEDYDEKKVTVVLPGVNMIDVYIPDWLKQEQSFERNIISNPQPVPLENVRLVYPLPDPETGIPRDVVIDRVAIRHKDLPHRLKKKKAEPEPYDTFRVILGTNTVIPWPEEPDKVEEPNEVDTPRMAIDEETFRPFLIRPPMPLSVIDELRNKYSKFRTRHDYDYKLKKEEEAEKERARKGLIKTMRTPLQELAALRKKQARAEEKELTNEQLAKIGEIMAQEQARTGHIPPTLGQ